VPLSEKEKRKKIPAALCAKKRAVEAKPIAKRYIIFHEV